MHDTRCKNKKDVFENYFFLENCRSEMLCKLENIYLKQKIIFRTISFSPFAKCKQWEDKNKF
jgi:hypothetical protein